MATAPPRPLSYLLVTVTTSNHLHIMPSGPTMTHNPHPYPTVSLTLFMTLTIPSCPVWMDYPLFNNDYHKKCAATAVAFLTKEREKKNMLNCMWLTGKRGVWDWSERVGERIGPTTKFHGKHVCPFHILIDSRVLKRQRNQSSKTGEFVLRWE